MNKNKLLRELGPELFPDRRIKITVDNLGRKRSLALHPWMLALAAVLLIGGLLLLGYFSGLGRTAMDRDLMSKLQQENASLINRIGGLEASVDSMQTRLDSLKVTSPEQEDAYYSYSGNQIQPPTELRVHPSLEVRLDRIETRLARIRESLDRALRLQHEEELRAEMAARLDGIPSIYPTFGEIRSGWGTRLHPITGDYRFHEGIDIGNKTGTPVYATADGVVSAAQTENGWGRVVKIDHAQGYMTLYAHLHSIKVQAGDHVRKGQIIGLMGSTGMSTGTHLHYGVYRNSVSVNPVHYLNRQDSSSYARLGR